MKRKFMLTATAVILAAIGVFAGIKKTVPSKVYFKSTGGTCIQLIASSVSTFFTNTAGTFQAAIKTVGGTLVTLWSTLNCTSNKVYFKN